MTARSESLGQDLKEWAAALLQVDVGAAPEKVRAAYFQQALAENGGPNLAAREAMLILTGRNNAARPVLALQAAEQKLQREVDDYASRFFSLPITERKAEWEMFEARGQGFPRVAARLAALRRGLYIVMPYFDRESVSQVATLACELFVLRPSVRSARRQARLEEAKGQDAWPLWTNAADLLRERHPAVASLEPRLIAKLANVDVDLEEKRELGRKMQKVAKAVTAGKKSPESWWKWGAIIFILMLLRGIGSMVSSPTPNAGFNANQPAFKVPPMIDQKEILIKNKFPFPN